VQTIPYRELFPDGLMQVNDKLFTKTLRFSDINYELAQPEDKEQTFDGLCDFYNALDSSMWAQMSFLNLRANLIDYRKSVTVPGQGDGCDDVRRELETILQAQLAKGNNGLIKRKYFTFGIEADSGQAARPRVERIEADLRNHLKNMGVRSEPLSGYDRLEVLHGIFHPDGREKLRFNWDAVVNTGLSTKPFIAPALDTLLYGLRGVVVAQRFLPAAGGLFLPRREEGKGAAPALLRKARSGFSGACGRP
jgi:hypothetical protein